LLAAQWQQTVDTFKDLVGTPHRRWR